MGGRVPRLTTRLNPLGGVGIPSDIPPAEIAKFTRSLEELAYHMRENARNIDFNLLSISDPTTAQLLANFNNLGSLFPDPPGGSGDDGNNIQGPDVFSTIDITQALGQMHPRVNDQYFIQSGPVAFPDVRVVLALLLADTRGHDDLVYKPKFRVASTYADVSVTDPGRADGLARAQRNAFIKFNPLEVKNGRIDLSFMGSFAYQGIIYAKGNIVSESDTKLRMLGSLISLGKIDLQADSSLTFNEEYCSLFGSLLPLGIVHFEEL